MTTKHTPGPWIAQPTAGHDRHGQSVVYAETGGRGTDVAIVYDGDADANVIAAAPDLLHEVENFATLVELIERWADADEGADDIMDNIVGLAQTSNPAAAIAKARGVA